MFNNFNRKSYSNILTKVKSIVTIKPEMIIKSKIVDYKVNKKSGEKEPIRELKLNLKYWQNIKEPINVILDEAHSILNSRRSMSKTNIILTDWMALIRRILGSNDAGHGELVLITQLPNRLDKIARDMAVQIKYVICHYKKLCRDCKLQWVETSEEPEKKWECYRCGSENLLKHHHIIEVFKFENMKAFYLWDMEGKPNISDIYYAHFYIPTIEKVFPLYDTLQWDNLFSEFY